MKKLIYAIILLTTLTSCAEKYSIVGTSSQCIFDGKMAYIKRTEDNIQKAMDSCEIVHGKFLMSGPLDSVICVSLFMGDANSIPVILEKGEINISIANSSIKVEGTPLNDKLYTFLTSRDSLTMLIRELPNKESMMYLEGYNEDYIIEQISTENAELRMALDKLETNFIVSNFNNILGVTWFMQLCNSTYNQYGYATTTPQIDEIYGRAPEAFRKLPEVVEYMKLVNGK